MIASAVSRLLRRTRAQTPNTPALPEEIDTIRLRAEQGHVLAQVQWGDILLNSVYLPRDPVRARQWFLIAAKAGYAPAHNMIGRCHHFGWGCPVDLTQAARRYEIAGQLGDPWGHYNFGILLMRGLGVTTDLRRALSLFRVAADAGHAKSMNLVARFTEEGWETARDPIAARDWYRRSAEGGDYRGQHNYATALLEQGDKEAALRWWRRAADNATSDILQAMDRRLASLGPEGDPVLLAQVRRRLEAEYQL
ncbi:hypothetical protein AA101099_0230 [Neoasaia chiangmaiensis NBRC 101099]|uniref:Uncharacterized protein n=1 Tax=Neoasaia chiangmaiensis TaxID=320497 RepID=A0A1U9KS15_9PROT|nr:tetratricopeptide repeat protein [Neoasaia chiangmaiensis]AQS88616.1 hypothetical protein A0U93_12500 [Neoasaia chiangmaiensis]GBR36084.1 hypothetical protein AA101099_0230 [Neoasaia chiangmaiensis NBRC 101099]GEN15477.1 hypothetical protein NCH01_19080 [Neoasaia chiangmaiensis]